MPCTMPGTPWPTAAPPAGSTPTSSMPGSSAKPAEDARPRSTRRRRRRRRRRDRRRRAAPGTARGPRRRSPGAARAPSTGTGAGPSPSRGSSGSTRRVATQSRMASLTASLSVRLPVMRRPHLGAEQPHAEHVERLALHVHLAHVDDALLARAGRPRWRWPRRAGRRRSRRSTRCLPMRWASSAWPSTLLILWLPVWLRSSRLSSTRTPSSSDSRRALGERRRAAGVVAQQAVELAPGRRGRPRRRGRRPPARRRPG